MLEIEAKISVVDVRAIEERLNRLDASPLGKWKETDAFFDFEDKKLTESDSALRLRVRKDIHSGAEYYRLTFKGPRQPGEFKSRQEIEISVNSSSDARDLLCAIGLRERVSYTKRRDSWKVDNCNIELDKIDGIGQFVEVEGPDESSIGKVLRKLDLSSFSALQKSYLEMVIEKGTGTTNELE